jgi:hypothetical protein
VLSSRSFVGNVTTPFWNLAEDSVFSPVSNASCAVETWRSIQSTPAFFNPRDGFWVFRGRPDQRFHARRASGFVGQDFANRVFYFCRIVLAEIAEKLAGRTLLELVDRLLAKTAGLHRGVGECPLEIYVSPRLCTLKSYCVMAMTTLPQVKM